MHLLLNSWLGAPHTCCTTRPGTLPDPTQEKPTKKGVTTLFWSQVDCVPPYHHKPGNVYQSSLRRFPHRVLKLIFLDDRTHWKNHTACQKWTSTQCSGVWTVNKLNKSTVVLHILHIWDIFCVQECQDQQKIKKSRRPNIYSSHFGEIRINTRITFTLLYDCHYRVTFLSRELLLEEHSKFC